jgi:hypothetical protein
MEQLDSFGQSAKKSRFQNPLGLETGPIDFGATIPGAAP